MRSPRAFISMLFHFYLLTLLKSRPTVLVGVLLDFNWFSSSNLYFILHTHLNFYKHFVGLKYNHVICFRWHLFSIFKNVLNRLSLQSNKYVVCFLTKKKSTRSSHVTWLSKSVYKSMTNRIYLMRQQFEEERLSWIDYNWYRWLMQFQWFPACKRVLNY